MSFAEAYDIKRNEWKKISPMNHARVIGVARIFDWGDPNHKSHAMTSSKNFKKPQTFCGAKIS